MSFLSRIPQVLKGPQTIRILSQRFYCAATGIKERIDGLVKNDKLVVFMKGVPDQPMCGFSNAVVQILRMHGVDNFASYNVLEDEDLRQGIKEYSKWPTIPQIYINHEFIGGCDIMIQMHQDGELIDELKKIGIQSVLLEKASD
ncbi:glutaredoxin-related protein 5, mitochondrial-like [Glandiceps talaboti]